MLAVPSCSTQNPESETTADSTLINKDFDVIVSSLLIGQGAEKYISNFKKHNIGQSTLLELQDADLIQLGINDAELRNNLLEGIKNLPTYKEAYTNVGTTIRLDYKETADLLTETSEHLNRIYLSTLANTLAFKKTKEMADILIYKDKYASLIAVSTINEIRNILHSMDKTLNTEMKVASKNSNYIKCKKILVGTIGSVAVATITIVFIKALRDMK